MFSQEKKRNSLNTIKINQLHKIICHFACDYLCATLVQLKEHQQHDTVQDGGKRSNWTRLFYRNEFSIQNLVLICVRASRARFVHISRLCISICIFTYSVPTKKYTSQSCTHTAPCMQLTTQPCQSQLSSHCYVTTPLSSCRYANHSPTHAATCIQRVTKPSSVGNISTQRSR